MAPFRSKHLPFANRARKQQVPKFLHDVSNGLSLASEEPFWFGPASSPVSSRPHRPFLAPTSLSVDGKVEGQTQGRDKSSDVVVKHPSHDTILTRTASDELAIATPEPERLLVCSSDRFDRGAQSRVDRIQSRVARFLAGLANRLGWEWFPGQRIKWRPIDWNGGAAAPNHTRFRGFHLGSAARKRWRRMRRARKGKSGSVAEVKNSAVQIAGEKNTAPSPQIAPTEQDTNHSLPPALRAQQPTVTSPTPEPLQHARNLTPNFRSQCSYRSHQVGPSFSRTSLRHSGMDPSNRSSWNPFNLPGPIRMPFTQDEDLMKYWLPPEPEPMDPVLETEAPGQQVRVGHVPVHKVIVEKVKDAHLPRTATSANSGYDSGISGLEKTSLDVEKVKDDQRDDIFTFLDQDAWWAASWAPN